MTEQEKQEAAMERITVPASIDQLETVQDFVSEKLEKYDCPMKAMMAIEIAVEEIFVNIANYAYRPEVGEATVCCEVNEDPLEVTIQFLDHGKPFNPLEKDDADISQDALLEREGGLGILMVKKSMDSVSYSYENGKNVLTILKKM